MGDSAKPLIQHLHAVFGGHVISRKATSPNQQNSSSIEWLNELELRSILNLILPHLYLKAEQAQLALWWLDHAKGRQTTAGYTGMEKARAAFAEELRAMKREPFRSSEQAARRILQLMQERGGRSGVHASIAVKVCKKTGYAYPSLRVLAPPSYLTDLHRLFAGQLQHMEANPMWTVSLSCPRKLECVLEHCTRHLAAKACAVMFLRRCAKAGNLRDGKAIHEAVKALNTQPYDPLKSNVVVEGWLNRVRFDLPKRPQGRPKCIFASQESINTDDDPGTENASSTAAKAFGGVHD
jgi:hypothetical protein